MIDREKVIALMGGNEALADKLISAFWSESEKLLPQMAGYLETGNWTALSNAAHIMKTQTAYVGLDALSQIAKEIEYSTRSTPSEPGKVAALLKLLREGLLRLPQE